MHIIKTLSFIMRYFILATIVILPGFSEELENIDATIERIVQKYDLPSMVGAVIVDGTLHATGVAGVRKAGSDIEAELNDCYHLGSCTKSMTCCLAAMLIEEGKLRWDSTVLEIFPEFAETMNPVYKAITVQQLMMQHSGLPRDVFPDGMEISEFYDFPGDTIQEERHYYTGLILQTEEVYQPGEKYLYSNAGYITLGAMIEKITGTSWESFIQERIFTPLEMTSAGIGTYGSEAQVDAPWWHVFDEDGQRIAYAPTKENDLPPVYAPAGLVHCSITDWAKYIQVHIKGEFEDQTILKKETIQRLHQPAYSDVAYACGWILIDTSVIGIPFIVHDGSNGMNLSHVWFSPQTGFATMAITNQGGETATAGIMEAINTLMKNYSPLSEVAQWEIYQ